MYLDVALIILLASGFYFGYRRGIIKTVFAIISILVAIIAAMKLSPIVIGLLDNLFSWDPRLIVVVGFVLTFGTVAALVRLGGKVIEGVMKKLEINFINKISGGIVMSLVFAGIFSCFIWLLDEVRLLPPSAAASSVTYEYVDAIPFAIAAAGQRVKPFFQSFWDKTTEAIDRIKEESEKQLEETNVEG